MVFSGAIDGRDRVTAACMGYVDTCVPIVLFVCSATTRRDNGLLLVTRPALACLLFKADCKGQTVPHPYREGWRAWLFEITPTVREIAVPFFERAGKKLPACLREGEPSE